MERDFKFYECIRKIRITKNADPRIVKAIGDFINTL